MSLRLYGNTDHGIGEVDSLKSHRSIFVTDCISSTDILETYTGTDITTADYLHWVLAIRVHLEETRDAFLLTRTCIVDIATSCKRTRINAEEAETTYIGVGCDLKCESTERLIGRSLTCYNLIRIINSRTRNLRGIDRAGEVCTNSIKKCLYPFILERRTTEHGENLHRERTLTDSSTDLIFCNSRRIVEVFFHECIVTLCELFKHLVAPFFGFSLKLSGDVHYIIVSPHRFIVPKDSFHAHEVHYTLEGFFSPYGDLDRTRISSKNRLHLVVNFEEVSTGTVHLIYVCDTRNIVLVSLTPYSFTLRLNTTYSTKCSYSTIEDTKRTLYLNGKVNVSRGVNKIDLVAIVVVIPKSSSSSTRDRNSSLLLLLHPVHGSGAIVHLTNLVSKTGIEENTLRSRSLTGINVRHDADIAS